MEKEIITGNEPVTALGRTKLENEDYFSTGLTIRQLMAKDFMASYLTHSVNTTSLWSRIKILFSMKSPTVRLSGADFKELSSLSIQATDALIAALNQIK